MSPARARAATAVHETYFYREISYHGQSRRTTAPKDRNLTEYSIRFYSFAALGRRQTLPRQNAADNRSEENSTFLSPLRHRPALCEVYYVQGNQTPSATIVADALWLGELGATRLQQIYEDLYLLYPQQQPGGGVILRGVLATMSALVFVEGNYEEPENNPHRIHHGDGCSITTAALIELTFRALSPPLSPRHALSPTHTRPTNRHPAMLV